MKVQRRTSHEEEYQSCPERYPAETIGIDLGDKMSRYLILNQDGLAVEEGCFRNSVESIAKHFGSGGAPERRWKWGRNRRGKLGHEVIVAKGKSGTATPRPVGRGIEG